MIYRSRRNWGIAALIVFVLAAGGFIYWQQLKEELAQDEKIVKEMSKPVTAKVPSPTAPGKKWVPHGDHFHEVDIDAPDTWQEAPSFDAAHDTQPPSEGGGASAAVEYPNPDNPVQALREYAKERGHWSADYIPDFPPEDTEAAQLALNMLIIEAHIDAGNTILDGPADAAFNEYIQTIEHYKGSTDQRYFDLLKLTWIGLDAPLGGDASQMFFGR